MPSPSEWRQRISVGFQVFAEGGEEEFGAVRDVCPDDRAELLVNVENGGDHCVPVDAIVDVHDEKVIVDTRRLPAELRRAVAHAHDAELPGY
jgi:uncharacterized protein YrrD